MELEILKIKKKNKRGWLRIIEATITILLILGIIALVHQKNNPKSQESYISEKLPVLLNEIAKTQKYRNEIITGTTINIKNYINGKIPGFNSDVEICSPSEDCALPDNIKNGDGTNPRIKGDIYSIERIIGASINDPSGISKKIKIYVWSKEI